MNPDVGDRTTRIYVLVSLLLTLGNLLVASLATVLLDTLVHRPPGAGSLNTLLPGSVYAMATVMKVCLVTGVASAILAASRGMFAGSRMHGGFPTWAATATALPVTTPLVGAIAILVPGHDEGAGLTVSDFSFFSRVAVFSMLGMLAGGALCAATSLARREHPRLLGAIALLMNVVLVVLFWHFEFYALGFDQDSWAPR